MTIDARPSLFVLLALFPVVFPQCGAPPPRTLATIPLPGVGDLRLVRRSVFTELDYQDVYDLEFSRTGGGRSVPAGKRHFNFIGWFDDADSLHLRRGRVLSKTPVADLHGRRSLPVAFLPDGRSEAAEDLVDVLWARRLYPEDAPGVDAAFLRACRDARGRRLDAVFRVP